VIGRRQDLAHDAVPFIERQAHVGAPARVAQRQSGFAGAPAQRLSSECHMRRVGRSVLAFASMRDPLLVRCRPEARVLVSRNPSLAARSRVASRACGRRGGLQPASRAEQASGAIVWGALGTHNNEKRRLTLEDVERRFRRSAAGFGNY